MEWTKTSDIPALLQEHFNGELLQIQFTQWESDDLEADEDVTALEGFLVECRLEKNAFSGLDAAFHFQSPDQEEITEILMDFPDDEDDVVASLSGETLYLYGNESTLALSKKA